MSILSIVQRLSLLRRYKCMDNIQAGGEQCVQVVHSSECLLLKVSLYTVAWKLCSLTAISTAPTHSILKIR